MQTKEEKEDFYNKNFLHHEKGKTSNQEVLDKTIFYLLIALFTIALNSIYIEKIRLNNEVYFLFTFTVLFVSLLSHILGYIYAVKRGEDIIQKLNDWHQKPELDSFKYCDTKYRPAVEGLNGIRDLTLVISLILIFVYGVISMLFGGFVSG